MDNLTAAGVLALVTLLAGPATNGADTGAVKDKLREFVSVKDFGALGDGVADDTAAIQAALNAAKGADNNAAGRSVFSLYFPSVPGGFYRVTETLVVHGTHGLVIHGDGALTERGSENATIRWYGAESKPVFQVKGGTGHKEVAAGFAENKGIQSEFLHYLSRPDDIGIPDTFASKRRTAGFARAVRNSLRRPRGARGPNALPWQHYGKRSYI